MRCDFRLGSFASRVFIRGERKKKRRIGFKHERFEGLLPIAYFELDLIRRKLEEKKGEVIFFLLHFSVVSNS